MNLLVSYSLRTFFLFFLLTTFASAILVTKEVLSNQDTLKHITLSEQEAQWLRNHKTITFVGDPNWLPFEAFDKEGNYRGIVADYLQHIEEYVPLKFNPIQTKNWSETIAHANAGDMDVISDDIDSKVLQKHYTPIPTYIKSPIVIVMREEQTFVNDLEEIDNRKIALIEAYGYNDKVIKTYKNIDFSYEENADVALNSLSEGKIDAVLLSMHKAQYLLSVQGYSSIKIVGKTKVTLSLTLFVKKEKPYLHSILKKTMQRLVNTKHLDIFSKWNKVKFADKVDYILVYQISGLFLWFVLGTWYWYRKLRKEVKKRKASENQMKMLMDNIPLNVIVSGYSGNILSANAYALKAYELSQEDIYKYNTMDFYAEPKIRDEIINTLKRGVKINEKLVKFRYIDGSMKDMMLSIIPIVYNNKKAMLSISVDITERIEMEEDLRKAKKSADFANKSKSEFLANMSHEIRTPMNAIMGFTELLNEHVKEPRLKSYTKVIQNAGKSLLTLINDILDLSKIEAGKLEIHKTVVDVHSIVNDVVAIFSMKVAEKRLTIVTNIDENLPINLYIDGIRLRQVLVNLVGNAVKFTEEGYINISMHALNTDEDLSKLDLEISVQDTGIGIPAGQSENIFNSFEQQEGQDNRKYGGTGLGLSISKRLVEMMDGTISVKSVEGKGATFFINLYGVEVSTVTISTLEDEEIEKTQICFNPAKVMVVDDVADNRALIVTNFEDTAIEIVTASDGFEAIEQFKKEKPDLILMDIRMPNMDGYEATKQIRTISDVPIVALTASIMEDEYEQTMSKGFSGYLRKPISKKELFMALSHFLAYQDVAIVEKHVEKYTLMLSDFSKESIEDIKKVLQAMIMPLYEKALQSNSISDMKTLSLEVLKLAEIYKIDALEKYVNKLNEAIDGFDIIQIKSLLQEFKHLSDELHSF